MQQIDIGEDSLVLVQEPQVWRVVGQETSFNPMRTSLVIESQLSKTIAFNAQLTTEGTCSIPQHQRLSFHKLGHRSWRAGFIETMEKTSRSLMRAIPLELQGRLLLPYRLFG